jgi:ABC-type transport system substrate-binding protein
MRRFIFSLFLSLFFVSGCSRAPREAGVLRLAQESDASTLDPAKAYDTSSIQFVRLMYRGLVDYDQKANIVNEIAASRSVSEDGKTYSFKLRPDVKYHDGTRVVAEDFRFALERVLDPETASDGLSLFTMIEGAPEWSKDREGPKKLRHVKGIEVRGDDEIIFRLSRADATFLNYLTLPFAYAVSPRHVAKLKEEDKSLSENPLGNGPFKMVEWVHDGWLKLEKNPNYFRPELPKAKRIDVQFGISSSLQIMLFEQGAIDILPVTDALPPDYLRLTRQSKWKNDVLSAPMMDVRYLAINTEIKPFDDVRVRRAMNYAINRDRIVGFLTGRATKARGALPPGMPAFNSGLEQYTYNPEKARQLLKEAGYQDKPNAPIPMLYGTSEPWYGKAAQSMQQDLKKVGMSVSLKAMPYGELKAQAGKRKTTPLSINGWIQDFPDPANFLDVLFNQKSITDVSSVNRAFYSNPKVNELLDQAAVETNRAARLKMYQEIEKLVVADAPWVFLHHTQRYVVRQPWVKGFQLHPMWSAVYENVGVE